MRSDETQAGGAALADWHKPLAELWERKRGARRMPARGSFDTTELRPWLGNLHLVEVLPDGDFRWRIYASNVAAVYGREWTGRRFSEVKHANPAQLHAWYADCVASRQPLHHRSDVDNEGRQISWSRLFLPLADDGEHVDKIFVHSHWLGE